MRRETMLPLLLSWATACFAESATVAAEPGRNDTGREPATGADGTGFPLPADASGDDAVTSSEHATSSGAPTGETAADETSANNTFNGETSNHEASAGETTGTTEPNATTDGTETSTSEIGDAEASTSSTVVPAQHTIFITANVYSADLGGLAGADAVCQALGESTDAEGPWIAVLADAENPLASRIEIQAPVVGLDDVVVSDDSAGFFSGVALSVVAIAEDGGAPADSVAWVGSATHDCEGWTSASASYSGQQALSTQLAQWLYGSSSGPCSLSRSLYCISQAGAG